MQHKTGFGQMGHISACSIVSLYIIALSPAFELTLSLISPRKKCIFIHPSIHPSIYQIYLSVCLFVCPSIHPSTYVRLYVFLAYMYLSVDRPIYRLTYQPNYLPTYLDEWIDGLKKGRQKFVNGKSEIFPKNQKFVGQIHDPQIPKRIDAAG